MTRTVQESKLFPVPAYMMLSYMMCYFRYPSLLRKIELRMSAEEIGDSARNAGIKIQNPSMGWALPGFYLLGREWLINLGLIRPQDAVEDLIYVMDFWKRFQLSWNRNNGHITNKEFGHRGQFLPERRLQVFHADMFDCKAGDELHEAAQGFMAAASQYGFLISCESRISLHNSGPYKLADDREMIVRDFMDLSESDFPWLDDVAKDVPYNNFTVTMAVKDCHFYLVDDWGSFESKPEFTSDKLVGVGLYTSDSLSDGYVPVAMGSRGELTACFKTLTDKIKDANNQLWRRIAGWTRDQMIDAGAITYFSIIKDLAHVAGVYEVSDWMMVDERAERFRPLFNDEYSRDALVGLCIGTHPSHRLNEYTMMQHSNLPQRLYSLIPYSILQGEDYTPTLRPRLSGRQPPAAEDRPLQHHARRIGLAEYNRLSRETRPPVLEPKFRHLCETWVKYHAGTPEPTSSIVSNRANSRLLKGKGSRLKRADVEKLRTTSTVRAAGPRRCRSAR